jgi:hypothetical protein
MVMNAVFALVMAGLLGSCGDLPGGADDDDGLSGGSYGFVHAGWPESSTLASYGLTDIPTTGTSDVQWWTWAELYQWYVAYGGVPGTPKAED